MDRYREKLNELHAAQFRLDYLETAVNERNQWIETCKAGNDDRYTVNGDLLAGTEPGLARLRTETVVDDYRYKLDTLRMPEFTESTTAIPDDPTGVRATPLMR